MKQVFLSCSLTDLATHRQAALKAVTSLGWQTEPDSPLEHPSKLFIGIYAVYYGDILPQEEVSLLEKHYQEACEADIPRLIYVIAPKEVWAADQLHTDERGAWMRMFWDRIHQENPHLRYFTTPSDLEEKIRFDLARLKLENGQQHPLRRKHLWWGMMGLAVMLGLLGLVVLRIAP